MTVPRYRWRVVAFGGMDHERIQVERFEEPIARDRRAKALVAEGKAVLICEVLDVLGGGDEGSGLPEPPRPRRRR